MPLLGTFGAAAARGFGMLSRAAAVIDEFFEYVTLLLPGNGTNGAQNNTFLDSSTNNFSITRNGDVTQGTFTPYGTNWSNFFDGSGDYLAFPAMSGFGTGDFTIEAWVYPVVSGTARMIVDTRTPDILGPYALSITASDKLDFLFSGSAPLRVTSTASIAANTWTHVAVSRASGTLRLFINGVQDGSVATSASITGNAVMWIGAGRADGSGNPGYYFNGYISNFRTLNGTGLYTTAFTPPTAPLTAITNTQVLTCQSNRFIDNSTNNFTITRNGDVSVQRFSPFNPTSPYAAGTIGGSGYFDDSGDYLTMGTTSSFNFLHNTSALFTIECWIYVPDSFGSFAIFGTASNVQTQIGTIVWINSSGNVRLDISNGVSGFPVISAQSSSTVPTRQWTHIAVTYSQTLPSGNCKFYINGVLSGTQNTSNPASGSSASFSGRVNAFGTSAGTTKCYLSGLRVNNSIVYSSAFTPPTAPPTQITGTSVLLNFTNGGIIDNSMMSDAATFGTAQISTSQSKFGGGSIALLTPGSDQVNVFDFVGTVGNFGTGDFTIESWVYFNSTSTGGIVSKSNSPTNGWLLQASTTFAQFSVFTGAASGISSSYSGSINTWTHIAVTRSSGTLRLYINGTQIASGTFTGDVGTNALSYVSVGTSGPSSSQSPLNGYLDDLRITKGIARYTTNFTPPTTPFPLQ